MRALILFLPHPKFEFFDVVKDEYADVDAEDQPDKAGHGPAGAPHDLNGDVLGEQDDEHHVLDPDEPQLIKVLQSIVNSLLVRPHPRHVHKVEALKHIERDDKPEPAPIQQQKYTD